MPFARSCSSTCLPLGTLNALAKRSSNEFPPASIAISLPEKAAPLANVAGSECLSVNSVDSKKVSKLAKRTADLSGFTEPRETQASRCLGWIVSKAERVGGAAGNSSANLMAKTAISVKRKLAERQTKMPQPARHLSIIGSCVPRTPTPPDRAGNKSITAKKWCRKTVLRHW
jgi:hypothetical protein